MGDNKDNNSTDMIIDDFHLELYLESDIEINLSKDVYKKENTVKDEIISWVKLISLSIICAFVLRSFIIINATVPTPSMENTIPSGSKIIASQVYCHFNEPKRLDILIFPFPDDEDIYFVKRVIGLPGEVVTIKNGKVYINDDKTPLLEPYLKEAPHGNYGPYIVPDNCYFMLGDNRNDSKDSRFWNNTYVKKGKFIGKVYMIYSPKIKSIQ